MANEKKPLVSLFFVCHRQFFGSKEGSVFLLDHFDFFGGIYQGGGHCMAVIRAAAKGKEKQKAGIVRDSSR